MSVRIQLIHIDLPAQRVAMNAQHLGRARLISVDTIQYPFDKTLFEFADCFLKVNPAFHHLVDQPFQLIFHDCTLRLMPCVRACLGQFLSSKDAVNFPILGPSRFNHLRWQFRPRGRFGPAHPFEIVAHKLFIK